MKPLQKQKMRHIFKKIFYSQWLFYSALVFLGVGILLRWMSFNWNTRLYGDVNLFALSAQQIVREGKLTYPMKYDYSPEAPYLTLSSPAGQHPPLYPLLAGSLARLLRTEATFAVLKLIDFFFGVLILFGIGLIALQKRSIAAWVTFGLIAYSAWLVDYSANGSPYILITFLLVVDQWLWLKWDAKNLKWTIWAGILGGIGWLTHGILIAIPLAFLVRLLFFSHLKRSECFTRVILFLLIFSGLVLPWLAWNQATYGKPFYSSSSYYLLEQLGLARVEIHNNAVQWLVIQARLSQIVQNYLRLVSKAAYAGLREGLQVLTPWGVLLTLLGLFFYFKRSIYQQNPLTKAGWKQIGAAGLRCFITPLGVYILTVFFWATYKLRFLVPLLPFFYLEIGIGFEALLRQTNWRKWLGWGLLAGLFIEMSFPYLQTQPNLYYDEDTVSNAILYDQMHPLAIEMGKFPKGVVLGAADSLDGGIETIYWSRQPFVAGRGFSRLIWEKLAKDFQVQYIWSDQDQEKQIRMTFPEAKKILSNRNFSVFQLP